MELKLASNGRVSSEFALADLEEDQWVRMTFPSFETPMTASPLRVPALLGAALPRGPKASSQFKQARRMRARIGLGLSSVGLLGAVLFCATQVHSSALSGSGRAAARASVGQLSVAEVVVDASRSDLGQSPVAEVASESQLGGALPRGEIAAQAQERNSLQGRDTTGLALGEIATIEVSGLPEALDGEGEGADLVRGDGIEAPPGQSREVSAHGRERARPAARATSRWRERHLAWVQQRQEARAQARERRAKRLALRRAAHADLSAIDTRDPYRL